MAVSTALFAAFIGVVIAVLMAFQIDDAVALIALNFEDTASATLATTLCTIESNAPPAADIPFAIPCIKLMPMLSQSKLANVWTIPLMICGMLAIIVGNA